MSRRWKIIALSLALVLAGTALAVAITFGMQRGTAVAAVVNGEVIYRNDLNNEVAALARQYGIDLKSKDGEKQQAEITRIVLDQMIDQRLIMQVARSRGAVATDAQIDAQIQEIKRNFSSDDEFQNALAQRGLSITALRDRLRINVTIRNLLPQIAKASVTDAEVDAYFRDHRKEFDRPEQVHARHILLQSEVEAKFVLAKLQRGEPFEALARQYSTDPGSKEQGGDLGFVNRGATVPEFDQLAFTMQPGQTSGIVHSKFGYHIIQVLEHKVAQPAKLDDTVRKQIREQLLSKKQEGAFGEWLKQTKTHAKIKRFERPTK